MNKQPLCIEYDFISSNIYYEIFNRGLYIPNNVYNRKQRIGVVLNKKYKLFFTKKIL